MNEKTTENGKKSTPLDAVEFVKPEEEKEDADDEAKRDEKAQPVSFFKLYTFATGWDKFIISIGILATCGTGVIAPLNILFFGTLTGEIISYAEALQTGVNLDEATASFMDAISYFAIMNSVIGALMLVLSYVSTVTFNYTALRQIFKIRSKYIQKILDQDISWYDLNDSGDLASRMTDDLTKFEDGIGEKVPTFLNFQVTFIASLILALVKGWELALICLVSLPLSMVAIGIIAILTSKLAKNEMDAYAAAGSIAEEVLSSIRTVVAFGGQYKEMERYNKNLLQARNNNVKRGFLSGIGFCLLWFFIYSSYALAFWYGVKLLLQERGEENPTYTPQNMIIVFFSVMTGSMNFGISSPFIEAFSIAKAAGGKVFQIIESKPVINHSKGRGEKIDQIKGNILFKNVEFHYPSRKKVQVLKGLNLEIKAGETVALVGSSGCGKSTCVQLVQRYYDPDSGDIYIDDKNLKDLDLSWLRSHVGVVGQEPVLFGTTIEENIRYGHRNATQEDIINAAKRANAHDFIKMLPNGYQTMVGERGTQLSGGQKQRVAIARALVRNPAILLLDEATSALDTNSEAKVQAALDSASKGCTTIIVAHRLTTIRNANKIVVISDGRVVEQGTHDELMALEKEYYNLVTTQVQSDNAIERRRSRMKSESEQSVTSEKRESLLQTSEDDETEIDDERLKQSSALWPIMKINSPEWIEITLGCLGAIFMGCAMPLFAVIMGSIIGTLSNPDEDYVRTETNRYCLFFVYAGIASGISSFFQIYMFTRAGEQLTMRLRRRMFQALLIQEIGYFDRKENGVGALCARLSGEAAHVQGATGQRIGTVLQALATLGLSVGLAMYYEWRLGLVAMSFTPFILLATYFQRRQEATAHESHHESLQKSTKVAVEAVSNIKTVASLGCEETFYNLYIAELVPHLKRTLKNTHGRAIILGLSRSLMLFAYSACMYYGGLLIRDGLSYEKVFKVSQALIMGTVSIANAFAFTPNFQKGIVAARKVMKLLNRVPKIKDAPGSKEKTEAEGNIQYSDVHFSYPTRQSVMVLQGLDLSVLQGKTVALVGPSGCGKSTIIQLIERFYDPLTGRVTLDDDDLQTITLASLRSHLGIVSQEPNLFNRTIADNIAYGDNCREVEEQEIIEAAKNANIHNFITGLPLGYETKLGEKGTQLSGGQKQRIAIARALVRNPKVLLLDEATSALDSESEKIVQEALDNAKKGRTCITIAHRLTTIQDADLICVIDGGIVAEMGTHQELIKMKGLYYKLHSLQHK